MRGAVWVGCSQRRVGVRSEAGWRVRRTLETGCGGTVVAWWDAITGSVSGTGAADGRRDAGLRRRETRLVDGGNEPRIETVDHGKVIGYAVSEPVTTAGNRVMRVGTHEKYGLVSSEFARLVESAGGDR